MKTKLSLEQLEEIMATPRIEILHSKYVPKGTVIKMDTRQFKKFKLGFLELPMYEFDEMIVIGVGEDETTTQ